MGASHIITGRSEQTLRLMIHFIHAEITDRGLSGWLLSRGVNVAGKKYCDSSVFFRGDRGARFQPLVGSLIWLDPERGV